MKIIPSNFKMYLLFAFVIFMHSSFSEVVKHWENDFKKIDYIIKPKSVLQVNGKTNVNSFCCNSNERFQSKNLDYKFVEKDSSLYFQNTKFSIKIKELDCGKKKINKDLFKALKVEDYPEITIHLKEVLNHECTDMTKCGEWMDFEANTDITITCETKPFRIPILVKKLEDSSYRIMGGTTLKLCDFDIKAPTAMLGLIKVKDEIDFNFDLYVDITS